MLGGALLVVPLLGLVIAWGAHQVREKRLDAHLAAAIQEIREQGEPTTAEELYAIYTLPAGVPDATELWMKGLSVLETPEFKADARPFPRIGMGKEPVPSPGEPWTQHDEVRQFLEKYQPVLDSFHSAAALDGSARFPASPIEVVHIGSSSSRMRWEGRRLLDLATRFHAYERNPQSCALSIRAQLEIANCNPFEPTGHLDRLLQNSSIFELLEDLLPEVRFGDQELAAIQKDVRQVRVETGLPLVYLGERVRGLELFADRKNPAIEFAIEFLEMGHSDQENLVICLAYMTRFLAASREPWPQAFLESERIDLDWRREAAANSVAEEAYDRHVLANCQTTFYVTTRTIAWRNAIDAGLGVERYRLQHGKLPTKLSDLVPDYLPSVPLDPFDGAPLRYQRHDDGSAAVNSVGKYNRADVSTRDKLPVRDISFRIFAKPSPE